MMQYLYVRRDKGGLCYPPLAAPSDLDAFRTYVSVYGMFDPDILFYRIGIFNSDTGFVEGTDAVDLSSALAGFSKEYFALVAAFERDLYSIEFGGDQDDQKSD